MEATSSHIFLRFHILLCLQSTRSICFPFATFHSPSTIRTFRQRQWLDLRRLLYRILRWLIIFERRSATFERRLRVRRVVWIQSNGEEQGTIEGKDVSSHNHVVAHQCLFVDYSTSLFEVGCPWSLVWNCRERYFGNSVLVLAFECLLVAACVGDSAVFCLQRTPPREYRQVGSIESSGSLFVKWLYSFVG